MGDTKVFNYRKAIDHELHKLETPTKILSISDSLPDNIKQAIERENKRVELPLDPLKMTKEDRKKAAFKPFNMKYSFR